MARPRGTDSAQVIQVIKTESMRGEGTQEDLCRIVKQYKNRSHKCLKKLRKEVKAMRKELLEIRRFLEPFSKPIVINGSEVSKAVQKSIRGTFEAISETSRNREN